MVDALVSIIVPVYNVEKHLNRCVESIVNQTYSNLEIILVDDGSPDRCPEMCDEWAKKDNRIRVIHKQNAGLGFARNTGMENATGDYICFVDSDDYVSLNMIEDCCTVAEEMQADLVVHGHFDVGPDGQILKKHIPKTSKPIYVGTEVKEKLLPRMLSYDVRTGEDWSLSLSAWDSFIDARIVRKIGWRFVSEREIICEDYYSMFDLFRNAEKVVIQKESYYYYVINQISTSRIYRRDRYEKLKKFSIAMHELAQTSGCEVDIEVATVFLGLLMGHLKQIVSSSEAFFSKLQLIRRIVNDTYLQDTLRNNDFSEDSLPKKALYWSMKRRNVFACWLLAVLRNLKG